MKISSYKVIFYSIFLILAFNVVNFNVAEAQVINCGAGFNSGSGACGFSQYGGNGGNNFYSNNYATGGISSPVSGNAAILAYAGAPHNSNNINYQTAVNIQAFTATFTFRPNGQNLAFVIQNDLNSGAGQYPWLFSGGAGKEAGFTQFAGGPNTPPINTFGFLFDQYSPLTYAGSFSYSSAQIYGTLQATGNPPLENGGYLPAYSTTQISTSPVPLNSPATSQGNSSTDTFSATLTYDGWTFTVKLYDVTAGGSCPGASCFTQSWSGVLIPEIVQGNTAYVGFSEGTSGGSTPPIGTSNASLIYGFTYTVNTPTGTPTYTAYNANSAYNIGTVSSASPVYSVAPGTYSSAQSVAISTSTTPNNYVCYVLSATTPTFFPQPDQNGGCVEGTLYNGPVSIPSTSTLYAMAGSNNSAFSQGTTNATGLGPPSTLVAGTYTINPTTTPCNAPTFSNASGAYNGSAPTTSINTTISSSNCSTITTCYTVNGATSCTPSTAYSSPIYVANTLSLCAQATGGTGFSPSPVSCANYTMNNQAMPVILSPPAGTYTGTQTVSMSTNTALNGTATNPNLRTDIFYTTDGTTPDATATRYSGPISVTSSETINAIAYIVGSEQLNMSGTNTNWKAPDYSSDVGGSGGTPSAYSNPQGTPTGKVTSGCYSNSGAGPCMTFFYTPITNNTQSNILWARPSTLSNTRCDLCTTTKDDAYVMLGSNYTKAGKFEHDDYIWDLTDGYNMQGSHQVCYGSQCSTNGVTADLDVGGNAAVGWIGTGLHPAFTGSVWHHKVTLEGRVLSELTTKPCYSSKLGANEPCVYWYKYNLDSAIGDLQKGTCTGTGCTVSTFTACGQSNGCVLPMQTLSFSVAYGANQIQTDAKVTTSQSIVQWDDTDNFTMYHSPSQTNSNAYTINAATPTASAPSFSPAGGTYTANQTVSLTSSTPSNTILYCTTQGAPCTPTTTYSAPITVTPSTGTVYAYASASGYNNSATVSAQYTINYPAAATPTANPPSGTYTGTQTVTLSSATNNNSIYYTTDGSTPTTSSTLYTGSFPVSTTTTVNAIAVATNYSQSAVGSFTYTIAAPSVAPIISPGTGTYTSQQSVSITSTTPSAVIYYTTDGSTPTTGSMQYSSPFTVATNTTIKAFAQAPGTTASTITTATLTINLTTTLTIGANGSIMINGKVIIP